MTDNPEFLRTAMAGMVSLFLDQAAECDPSNPGWQPPIGETAEQVYAARNQFLVQAAGFASVAGYSAGYAIDPAAPDWPVLLIDLPTGQVSWHLPAYPGTYDGHTTAEKYARVKAFSDQIHEAHDGLIRVGDRTDG